MPELPEVEASRILVSTHCLGLVVDSCVANEQGGGPRDGLFDDIIIDEGVSNSKLTEVLVGRTLTRLERRGKQLFFTFADTKGGGGSSKKKSSPAPSTSVLFHFGMTGAFAVKGYGAMKYKAFKVDEEHWPPRFCKLEIKFKPKPSSAGGKPLVCLAFADPRRLGRIRIREGDPLASPPLSLLAPDPVYGDPPGRPLDEAAAVLSSTTAPIKAVLLDQSRLVCGIGNWVCDDVLYESKIHPAIRSCDLSIEQVTALMQAIASVCKHACDVGADATRFPEHWLFHPRWKMRPKTSQTLPDGRYLVCETLSAMPVV